MPYCPEDTEVGDKTRLRPPIAKSEPKAMV